MKARGAVALGAGALFGLGLVVSGMSLPSKVVGFLDFTGGWDPTLAFVMAGAIGVHAIAHRLVRRPLLAPRFSLPAQRAIDGRLLLGSAIFGLGWGLGGYCPGPAVTGLWAGHVEVIAFVVAMLGATWITRRLLLHVRGEST